MWISFFMWCVIKNHDGDKCKHLEQIYLYISAMALKLINYQPWEETSASYSGIGATSLLCLEGVLINVAFGEIVISYFTEELWIQYAWITNSTFDELRNALRPLVETAMHWLRKPVPAIQRFDAVYKLGWCTKCVSVAVLWKTPK